jgi:hypothetical protein
MTLLPSERSETRDPLSGRTVVRWTSSLAKDQHLYFTSPSVTADDRWLVMLSERDGHPNLWAIDRRDGTLRRLTANASGLLRSYVYPYGGDSGLSKASPSLDPVRGVVGFVQDHQARVVDLATGRERVLCEIPGNWVTAFTHFSGDGRWFCVPCSSPGAFADDAPGQNEQMWNVMARFYGGRFRSRILRIEVATGRCDCWAEVPFWVTHVNFDPARADRLIFNKEGFSELMDHRIWCLEPDGTSRPLWHQGEDEWSCHENWTPDGAAVVYHGGVHGRGHVAARTWEGRLLSQIPVDRLHYGHATPGAGPGEFITDGIDGCISRVTLSSDGGTRLEHLCRHGSAAREQDTHVHPLLTPDRRGVVFTSDALSQADVYEVRLA